jgi:hypothetical protein
MELTDKTLKVLFNGSSLVITWGLRIFLIMLLITALIHVMENPVVIVILSLVIGVILYFTSDGEYLILRTDGLVYRQKYWAFWNVDTFYDFKDITFLSVSGDYTLELDTARNLLPSYQPLGPNTIDIYCKNGDLKQLSVYIYKDKLIDFTDLANDIIRKHFTRV